MQAGTPEGEAEAERLYREILPLLTFAMQSLEGLLTYGKRITATRLGFDVVHDRPPALPPTDFGLACVARYAAPLGRLGRV
jgi:4-hydroxy-tetrahydrodipicolinate synthase